MAIPAMLDYAHAVRGRRPLHPGRSGVTFLASGPQRMLDVPYGFLGDPEASALDEVEGLA
jgi:hypothetical protein